MEIFKDSKQKNKKNKRIGRGGSRGTSSGRGTKGQGSRSGHRIRPAERDFLIRIPKLRGYKNKSFREKPRIWNVENLQKSSKNIFSSDTVGKIKILGRGDIKKSVTVSGLKVSKIARDKIIAAGGKIE